MKNRVLILALFSFVITLGYSQNEERVNIPPIPKEMHWVHTPLEWNFSNDKRLMINGGKGSRLFTDPQQNNHADTAPMLLFNPDETFLFSCKVKVEFKSVFDAGVLMVYGNTNQWAKFCFEYSPDAEPMIICVVNNKLSDESVHETFEKNEIYMRIAGYGNGVYAFHYSHDEKYWHLARYFYLDPQNDLRIGFLSQSPRGENCISYFSEINYSTDKLKGLRTGD